ncbi:MAG: tRNA (adenosine(37)-N6)-threonylcarbamoyltransferase complex ATPase subunit type 1 TsaE, partial [Hyphomicrobiales bacterium]|nr:tRNA (adenosine(37)-N6)-threonylcarbamoyltransferase complex ATPase subunit type 1 TsaE [Hyphomicrobiales bacterium]
GDDFPIVHADLYRIAGPQELADLGWDEATDSALVLVEWAERAGGALPADRLDVRLTIAAGADESRMIDITGAGTFVARLARAKGASEVLRRSGWLEAERTFMLGDASTRAYERLTKPDGARAILMISPPRPDGPPVRYGKPYSAIAHLAENIRPFVAMDHALRAKSLSAPEIYAADLDGGFAVLEDLGAEGVVDEQGPIRDRYAAALDVLAHLHGMTLPDSVPLSETRAYRIPPYDLDALLIEVELLTEWYAPHIARTHPSSGARASFVNLWRQALADIVAAAPTWTLRDYHSPNLIWLEAREGLARVGIIDFQDCVMGHPAYDVASLLQDARVTVPDDLEIRLLGHYAQARRAASADFDMAAFARAYALLGAQRATKILGIFARLDKRDGKPQYLDHLPRVARYLRKNLAHPALAPLRDWYAANLPRLLEGD